MGESQELSLYFRGRTSAVYVFTRNVAPHARIYTKWISNEANKDVLSLQTPQYQNALHADRSCANRPLQLSFTAIPPVRPSVVSMAVPDKTVIVFDFVSVTQTYSQPC